MYLSVLLWMGIGVIVISVAAILFFFRGSSPPDLFVSGQWIAEHRTKSDERWLSPRLRLRGKSARYPRSTIRHHCPLFPSKHLGRYRGKCQEHH